MSDTPNDAERARKLCAQVALCFGRLPDEHDGGHSHHCTCALILAAFEEVRASERGKEGLRLAIGGMQKVAERAHADGCAAAAVLLEAVYAVYPNEETRPKCINDAIRDLVADKP